MRPHSAAVSMEGMQTSATEATPAAPDSKTRRLPLLDVLRGLAIVGTLGTNVWLFTGPGSEGLLLTGNPVASDGPWIERAVMFATNGKFISMLTFMFGVGLAIQYRSAARRGRRWPGRYHWRALFLFLEGTVHFTLVFAFDVLMGYAVAAVVVAWLLTRSQRAQRVVMWTALGLHLAIMGLLTAAMAAYPAAGPDPEAAAEIEAVYASGSWTEQIGFRLDNLLLFRSELVLAFAMMLFLFLLGVRLFRAGAFGGDERGRTIRNRMLAWGLGLGLPLNLAMTLGPEYLALAERYATAPLLAFGYIGLTGWIVDHVRKGPVMTGLESLGRAALSGYVLQNLAASVVCYGWGLGLAEKTGGSAAFGFGLWAAISVLLVAGARLWALRFPSGPAEMLQKRLLR